MKWGEGVNHLQRKNTGSERQRNLTDKSWILVLVLPKVHCEPEASFTTFLSQSYVPNTVFHSLRAVVTNMFAQTQSKMLWIYVKKDFTVSQSLTVDK